MSVRILVVLALVNATAAATAAPGTRPRKAPAATAATTATTEALALFEQSRTAYRAGRFADAVTLLERAYALRPEAVLLYNLGRAYEGLGDVERALASYRAYLAQAPDAPDRLSIAARISTLGETLAERARIVEERRAAIARADAEAHRRRDDARRRAARISSAPWILAGVGIVGIGVGGGLGIAATGRRSDAESAPSQERAAAKLDEATRLAFGANIAFGIGGALAIGGTVWGALDWRRARRARSRERSVIVIPTRAGAALVVQF